MALGTLESTASFIGMHGQQEVRIKGGEAHLALVQKRSGTHSLRFWLDLEGGVTHHDVELQPSERLFFFSNCWEREMMDESTAKLRQIEEQIEDLEARSAEVERAATTDAWRRMRSFHDQEEICASSPSSSGSSAAPSCQRSRRIRWPARAAPQSPAAG